MLRLSSFSYKQVIVVRSDLGMSKGKTAVQVAHASLMAAERARGEHHSWWKGWLEEGQCKVVVRARSEAELLRIEGEAKAMNLPTGLVQDRGLTEVPPGTYTCLGIGPAPKEVIDRVTGTLPLL